MFEESEFDLNSLVYPKGIFGLNKTSGRRDIHDVALVKVVCGSHLCWNGNFVSWVAFPPRDLGAEVRNSEFGFHQEDQAQDRERHENEGNFDNVVLRDGVGDPNLFANHDERVEHEDVPGVGLHLVERESSENRQGRMRQIGEREKDRDEAREREVVEGSEHEDIAQRKRPQYVGDEVDASRIEGFGMCHFSLYFSVESRFP